MAVVRSIGQPQHPFQRTRCLVNRGGSQPPDRISLQPVFEVPPLMHELSPTQNRQLLQAAISPELLQIPRLLVIFDLCCG
jgi:hypothetical protein